MSKYTTELRFICETAANLQESCGYTDVNRVIQAAIPNVFNFDFPIFDEDYRNVLCTKILKHYYTREIGEESVGLWKLRMDARLNEIMPYYNQLYKSAELEFNPLHDTDVTTVHKGSGESEGSNTYDGTTRDLYSDTPQGSLQNVENETYLTDARKTTNGGSGENKAKSTDEYINTVTGKTGAVSFSKMLEEYRATFLNIDKMVIGELSDLFITIW